MRVPLGVLLSALCVDCIHLLDTFPDLPDVCVSPKLKLARSGHLVGFDLQPVEEESCDSQGGCGIDNQEQFPFPAKDIFGNDVPAEVDCVDFTYDKILVRSGTTVVANWQQELLNSNDPVKRALIDHAWVGAVEQTCADFGNGRMRCDPNAMYNKGWCTDLASEDLVLRDWIKKKQLAICKDPCVENKDVTGFDCNNTLGDFTAATWNGMGAGPWPRFDQLKNLLTGEAYPEPNPGPLPCALTDPPSCDEQDCDDAFGFDSFDLCENLLCVSPDTISGRYPPTISASQACCACGGGIRRPGSLREESAIQQTCTDPDMCQDLDHLGTVEFRDPFVPDAEPVTVWADIKGDQVRVCRWRAKVNASHFTFTNGFNPNHTDTLTGATDPITSVDELLEDPGGMIAWDLGNMGRQPARNNAGEIVDELPMGWENPDLSSGMTHTPGWCSDEEGLQNARQGDDESLDECGGGDCDISPKQACCACGGGCVKFPCPLTGQWDESFPGAGDGCTAAGGCATTRVRCPGSSDTPSLSPTTETAQPTVNQICQICPNGTAFDGEKKVDHKLFCQRTKKYGRQCDTCEEASKRDMTCEYRQELLRDTCCPYVVPTPEPPYPATPEPPYPAEPEPEPAYPEPEPECGDWVQGRNCKGFKHRMVIVKRPKYGAYGQRQKKRVQKVMSQETCWELCEDNDMFCCRWQIGTGKWKAMDWGKCWGTRADSVASTNKYWAKTACGEPVTPPPTYKKPKKPSYPKPKKPSYPKKPSTPQYRPPPSYPTRSYYGSYR